MPAVEIPERGPVLPSAGESRLVTTGDPPPVLTLRRETDARTALMRGLAEYLRTLSVVDAGGRELRFASVVEGWSEPEPDATYPWACVYSTEEAPYAPSRLVPSFSSADRIGDTDSYLVETSSYEIPLRLEFWTGTPAERTALNMMLEDELQYPAAALGIGEEKYGFRLELPHYHGLRASYAPQAGGYIESGDDARNGRFKAWQRVSGRVPVCRVVTRPRARIRSATQVSE